MKDSTGLPSSGTVPPRTTATVPIACPRCGVIDTPTLRPGKGPHAFRALCQHCGRFLQWLSQSPPAERQARHQQARLQATAQQPPSQAQLTFVQALGDDDPLPATMVEASQRIDTLKRGRGA